MSRQIPWQRGVGLVLPERVTLDTADSAYTEAETVAGVPVPTNASGLVASASGSAPAVPIRVRTQRGGQVGIDQGATYIWRREPDAAWLGMDEPSSVQDAIVFTGAHEAATAGAQPLGSAVALSSGDVLIPIYREAAIGPDEHRIEVHRLTPDGTQTSALAFVLGGTPLQTVHAAICQLQNGRVLLFTSMRDEGSETSQVRADYSDDGGATWANATVSALPTALPQGPGATIDYRIAGLSAAAVDSTICLMVQTVRRAALITSYRDLAIQYASRDGGSSFAEVFRTVETSTVDGLAAMADTRVTATLEGSLLAAWVGEDGYLWRRVLASPYDPVDATPPERVDALLAVSSAPSSSDSLSSSRLALTTAEDGRVWLVVSTISTYAQALRSAVSYDGGRRWRPGAVGIDGVAALSRWDTTVPVLIALAPLAGRLVLSHAIATGLGPEPIARAVLLGRPSTVTLPPYYTGSTSAEQVSWTRSWWGTDPEEWEGVLEQPAIPTAAGAAVSGGWRITGTPGRLFYGEDLTADDTAVSILTRGLIRRYAVAVTVGGSLTDDEAAVRVAISDGVENFDVSIRHTTTGFRVKDNNSAAVGVGTDVTGLTAGSEVEIQISTVGRAVRVWYRVRQFDGENPWILSHSFTADNGGDPDQAVIEWGHLVDSTTTSTWRWNGHAAGIWVGTGLPAPYVNPRDLNGRPWSPRASVVQSAGLMLRGYGVTVRGDGWRVDGDSDVRIDNVITGGPRIGWEAADDSATELLFDLSSHNAITTTDVLVVSGFEANVGYIRIIGIPLSGSPVTLFEGSLSAGMEGLHFGCSGDRVRPATGSAGTDAPVFAFGELAGSQWSHYAGGAWRSFKILNNREGKWTNATTARTAILVDGALPTAGSGTDGRIVPSSWAVQVSMRGQEFERLKVEVPAPNTSTIPGPAGGRWRIGRLHVGYATAYVYDPSWGERVTHDPIEEVVESRDGQRIGLELAPTRRRVSVGFVDGTITYGLSGGDSRVDGDPEHFAVDSGADPFGLAGLELMSLEGVMRATRGAREMVYLTDLQAAQAHVHNRRDSLILCYLDSQVARERFAGTNMYGDALRGDVVELVEAT